MVKVVGVNFKPAGKIYYFDPGDLQVKVGDHVIVETARGTEFGTINMAGKRNFKVGNCIPFEKNYPNCG